MANHLLEALAVFVGVGTALCVAAVAGFFWTRRRFRMIRARLIMRVASGDLSLGGFIAAIRFNRHSITTAMVRRKLRVDVDGAVAAVHAAERAGAPVGDLGSLAAELDVAAQSIDGAMASMGPSGVTPVVLARAGDLGISANQLRRKAEHLLAAAAVPDHAGIVHRIQSIDEGPVSSRTNRSTWSLLTR